MNIRQPILTSLAILVGTFIQGITINAQPNQQALSFLDIPKFYFDALSFRSDQPGKTRLDVYVEVPHEALQFIKEGTVFRASYEIAIDISDTADNVVTEKFWTEKIETKDYDQSISPRVSNLSQKSFYLSPGSYTIGVQIEDNVTQKLTRSKRRMRIRDYSNYSFSMSDIMLVKKLSVETEKRVIYPNISGNVADASDYFHIFFEIYNNVSAESSNIYIIVRNLRGDIVESDTFGQRLGTTKQSSFVKVKSSKLVSGEYTIDVKAIPVNTNSEQQFSSLLASSSRSFTMRWRELPHSIFDLDLAIDQLQYLTEKETIEDMRKAPPGKKREMWRDFWKKKDPTPTTEQNEMMEEYFARVEYANKNFSHYMDGWKTDRGMVYIIFGPPSNIERHPFDSNSKPYEVWSYYELSREFVFVDSTGFGDYRLETPIWDVWRTRPRQ